MECVGEDSYWLAKTIRRFSEIYVREVREGSDPGRPSPIDDLIGVDEKRQSVKRQFKNFLKAKAR